MGQRDMCPRAFYTLNHVQQNNYSNIPMASDEQRNNHC